MHRTADGPHPQHVGPLRRTAKTRSFCAWPSAANRDGSRSVGGSAKCARWEERVGRFGLERTAQFFPHDLSELTSDATRERLFERPVNPRTNPSAGSLPAFSTSADHVVGPSAA